MPYNVGRRRGLGVTLGGTANLLESVTTHNVGRSIVEVEEQWGIANAKELSVLKDAHMDLRKAIKRLRVLEKRFLA